MSAPTASDIVEAILALDAATHAESVQKTVFSTLLFAPTEIEIAKAAVTFEVTRRRFVLREFVQKYYLDSRKGASAPPPDEV